MNELTCRFRLTVDHDAIVIDRWVIDLDTLQVEMGSIVLVKEPGSQVRDILACIALTSDVNLVALHAEGLDEASPEVVELIRDVDLILHGSRTGRETRTGRLIDVNHVGQVRPGERIADRLVCARLPHERTMFLEKAVEGTTPGTAIQPDGNLD